jgi:hypothetical protein
MPGYCALGDVTLDPMSRIQQLVVLALIILGSCLLPACARLDQSQVAKDIRAASGNDQKGYLHVDPDSVMFLHWTEVKGKLNGQMNIFYAKGVRGKTTENSSHSFEGVTDGKNISLSFTGSQWTDGLGGKTWTGTISGNELTLVIPINNGTLAPVKFGLGTVEQYNQAVAGISQSVQDTNTKIQQQNAEAARIQTERNGVIEGNNRVQSSLRELTSATNELNNSLKFDDVFDDYARAWEKMKVDYQKLQEKAAEKPLTSYKLGEVQYLLGGLQYDVGIFQSHSGTVDYKINATNSAIKSVREDQKNLGESWQFLQRAVAANSTGDPAAQFSDSDISQPIKASEEKVQQASKATQQASQRRSTHNGQAKDLYRKADAFVKTLKSVD